MSRKTLGLLLVFAFLLAIAPIRLWTLAIYTQFSPYGWTRVDVGNENYWRCKDLQSRLETLGWSVSFSIPEDFGAYGMTFPESRHIVVSQDLHWNACFSILAHEAGHALDSVSNHSTAEGEAFAEGVAYLIARDRVSEHSRYLARNRAVSFLTLISESDRITAAARFLTE